MFSNVTRIGKHYAWLAFEKNVRNATQYYIRKLEEEKYGNVASRR